MPAQNITEHVTIKLYEESSGFELSWDFLFLTKQENVLDCEGLLSVHVSLHACQ